MEPILFIQTAFLGDLILSVPTLLQIKKRNPDRPLFVVCRKGLGDFLIKLKVCDQIFEVQKKNKKSYDLVLKKLKIFNFSTIYCAHESVTSVLFQSRLKATTKIGFKKWWNFCFFDKRVFKNKKLPEALRQMQLLAMVDDEITKNISSFDYSNLLAEVPKWASPLILTAVRKKQVIVFPGSVWPTKRWTLQGFIEVSRYLVNQGFQVLLLGSNEEKDLCLKIQSSVPEVINQCGVLSLYESTLLISESTLVISNDSGGQHLASLSQTPTVSIFGPTVLSQGFRPWTTKVAIAELKNLGCRPCGAHGHQICPIRTHECMNKLSSQIVIDKIKEIISLK
jgi:heptosyltransferase-2